MPVLNLSLLLPSLARLSLRTNPTTQTGSARGAKQSLSGTFDDEQSPNGDSSRKLARRQSYRKCVGFIAVSCLHTTNNTGNDVGNVLFIDEFFVDPEARKNKIGRCLLEYAMSQGSFAGMKRAALIVRSTHPQQKWARHLYEQAQFAHAEVVPNFQGIPKLEPQPDVEEYWEAPIDWKGCDALQEKDAEGRVYVGDTEFFIDSVPIHPSSFLQTHAAIVKKANDHHRRNRHHKERDGDGSNVENILSFVNLGVYAAYTYERRVE